MKHQPILSQPFFPPSFFPLPSSLWTEWNIPRTGRMKVSRAGCWSSFITKSFSILSNPEVHVLVHTTHKTMPRSLRSRFNEARRLAHRRRIAFELHVSVPAFRRLTQGNCCYCGAATRAGRHQGIDRINSARGYHLRNCRPCCGPCNYMKHTMDLSDFLARCRTIARRFPSFEVPATPKVQVVASTNLAAPAVTPAPPVLRKRWVARPGGWIKRTWVLV